MRAVLVFIAALTSLAQAAEIEQRYVTTWDPSPVARLSLDEDLEITGVRCRLYLSGPIEVGFVQPSVKPSPEVTSDRRSPMEGEEKWGDWWNGRQVTWKKGPQVWHLPLGHLEPGHYRVQHDLRTPLGADWRRGFLRVPVVARSTGQPITLDNDLSDWPQSRFGTITQDLEHLWFAWDMDFFYIASRSEDPNFHHVLDLDLLPDTGRLRRVYVGHEGREVAIKWSELFPAGPHLGQVLRFAQGAQSPSPLTNPDFDGASYDELLFVGSGLPIYFGATWVSGAPGHDDQGPPPPILRSVEDRIPGMTCRSAGISWGEVEKEDPGDGPSDYDWSAIRRMRNLTYSGMRYVGISSWCAWAEAIRENEPERYKKLRERFLRECVQQLKIWGVEYYSCGWNEPELFHFTDREGKFLEDLNATVTPLRDGMPDAKVIAGKFCGGDPTTIRSFVGAGFRDNFDVLDIHPYSNDPRTGCAMGGVVTAHETLDELGMGHKRIFLGEGWGPTRNLHQKARSRHDAPVSAEEADFMRQFYWNGYRCLTQPREDYNPEWVLGAKFFTFNDNVGMTYWRVNARPHYNAKGEIDYYLLSHLAFGSLEDMNPAFWNGGLVDFYGKPKGPWLFDFPPSLPQVRLSAEMDGEFLLRQRPVPLRVKVVNAETEPITDLLLEVRHRTETFRKGVVSGSSRNPLPASLDALSTLELDQVDAMVEGGRPGPVRLAVEMEYTWRGQRYVADAIIRTELRDDVDVALAEDRLVMRKDDTVIETAVTLRNNLPEAVSGALFSTVPEGVSASVSPDSVSLGAAQSATYKVRIEASQAPAGLHTFDIAWGQEQGLTILKPLHCPRLGKAPTIDGDLSDWPEMDPLRSSIFFAGAVGLDMLELPVPFPVPTPQGTMWKPKPPPVSVEGHILNALAICGWDNDFFYIGAVVDDAVHYQPYDELDVWKADSLQVAFDPLLNGSPGKTASVAEKRSEAYQEGYGPDDYETGIALTPNGPQFSLIHTPPGVPCGTVKEAKVVVNYTDSHAVYEVGIPWQVFQGIKPTKGSVFGMDILVNDSDGDKRYTLGWADAIGAGKFPSRHVPVWLE
jgi:hypothetical protein